MPPPKQEWIEGQQRVRREGMVIRTTKRASIRLAYGDERVRELRAQRAETDGGDSGGWRGLLAGLTARKRNESAPSPRPPFPVPAPTPTERRPRRRPPETPNRKPTDDVSVGGKIGVVWRRFIEQRGTHGEAHPVTALTIHKLACLCRDAERYDEAARWFARAHAIWSARLGPCHASVARNLAEWAELMRRRGFEAEATRLAARAAEILARAS